jgi:hypothetical protein
LNNKLFAVLNNDKNLIIYAGHGLTALETEELIRGAFVFPLCLPFPDKSPYF